MGLGGDLKMAIITFSRQYDYFLKLAELEKVIEKGEILEQAVAKGAAPVADEIRKRLDAVPEDTFRRLAENEKLHSLSNSQKEDLADSFGLTPIGRDRNGFINTKAGFDGYGSFPTARYPKGVPNALLARSVESGSSVREKSPFVRPAVNATRKKAIAAMEESIDDDLKKIF